MTLKKIDYSNTIIYKIVCNDLSVTDCYVGNTTQFRQRKSQHKRNCSNSNSKKFNYPLYKFIREHSGWENFSMIEIEKYPCNDGNEARSRERFYFDLLNANLNKIKPLTTEDERKQIKKEYKQKEECKEKDKIYREEHKNEINEKMKIYRDNNKEKIQERRKKYKDEHKNEIKERDKIYREENKEKITKYREDNKDIINTKKREKVTCSCNAIISRGFMSEHLKSFKHISRTQQLFKPTDEIIHA